MPPPNIPYLRHIWLTTHRYKKLWLQATCGGSREGKTWCEIVMCEFLDPKFDISKIVFTAKEFMDRVEDMRHPGECLIFSELGIAHSARQWHSLTNILTNEVLQTFGYTHPIVFFDVPDFSFVDSQARKIMNAIATVTRAGLNPPKMWLNSIKIDRKRGDMYFPRPRIIQDGEMFILQNLIFKRKPKPDLLKEFLKKEEDYKGFLKKKNRHIISTLEDNSFIQARTVTDDIQQVISHPKAFRNIKGNLDANIIQAKLGLSYHKARQVQRMAQLKTGK